MTVLLEERLVDEELVGTELVGEELLAKRRQIIASKTKEECGRN